MSFVHQTQTKEGKIRILADWYKESSQTQVSTPVNDFCSNVVLKELVS